MSEQQAEWHHGSQGENSSPPSQPLNDGRQALQPGFNGAKASKKGKASGIISLILGLSGPLLMVLFFMFPEQLVIFFFLSYPLIILGLILGIVSLVKSKRGYGSNAFGLAGTIVSGIALAFAIFFIVFLAVFGLSLATVLGDNFSRFF